MGTALGAWKVSMLEDGEELDQGMMLYVSSLYCVRQYCGADGVFACELLFEAAFACEASAKEFCSEIPIALRAEVCERANLWVLSLRCGYVSERRARGTEEMKRERGDVVYDNVLLSCTPWCLISSMLVDHWCFGSVLNLDACEWHVYFLSIKRPDSKHSIPMQYCLVC